MLYRVRQWQVYDWVVLHTIDTAVKWFCHLSRSNPSCISNDVFFCGRPPPPVGAVKMWQDGTGLCDASDGSGVCVKQTGHVDLAIFEQKRWLELTCFFCIFFCKSKTAAPKKKKLALKAKTFFVYSLFIIWFLAVFFVWFLKMFCRTQIHVAWKCRICRYCRTLYRQWWWWAFLHIYIL